MTKFSNKHLKKLMILLLHGAAAHLMNFEYQVVTQLYCGGTPVFADIDERTYNIDPFEIEKKITSKTKAIMPIDFTGQSVDIDAIMDIARQHNLVVIEDGAHSLGANYKGRKVGSQADMTMFSFHPVKPITTGEGGMITTNSKELYEKLKLFRSHGVSKTPYAARKVIGIMK